MKETVQNIMEVHTSPITYFWQSEKLPFCEENFNQTIETNKNK